MARRIAALVLAIVLASAVAPRQLSYAAPPDRAPVTLAARYDANRGAVQHALAAATAAGDEQRAAALRALAAPGRTLYAFDARGDGLAVEVLGDLTTATRVAIIVPGSDTDLETFDARGDMPYAALGGGARALLAEAEAVAPHARFAVVAWLGYDTPRMLSPEVLSDRRVADGAARLRAIISAVHEVNGAGISLLCHSYGSLVCARAVAGAPVSDLVAYGSPGLGSATAAALDSDAQVWTGRGSRDWVRHLPAVFGADPVSAAFGARRFPAGSAAHSGYLEPGTRSLHSLAQIALGHG